MRVFGNFLIVLGLLSILWACLLSPAWTPRHGELAEWTAGGVAFFVGTMLLFFGFLFRGWGRDSTPPK